jgi:hypothetical protein
MSFVTHFADGFGHYDTAGIPLKWSTSGGSIDTTAGKTRTNGRSLKIQAGSSPTLVPNGNQGSGGKGIAGNGPSIIGFAWQTQTLAGETILQLQEYSSGDIQIKMVQNSDGSISLFNGLLGQLIGKSSAGILTTNAFYYLELMVNLNPFSFLDVTQAVLTITPDATHVAQQVINVTGFSSSQFSFNALLWGGPASPNFAWVADFYNQSQWTGEGDVTAVIGAPKIYDCVPKADGLDFVNPGETNPPQTIAFPGTAAPWWNQINEIPENTAAPIFETIGVNSVMSPVWAIVGQGFIFDVSAIPAGSTIAAVQVVNMFGAASGSIPNIGEDPGAFAFRTGDTPPTEPQSVSSAQPWSLDNQTSPFVFYCFPYDTNPIVPGQITQAQLSGAQALQFGPFVNSID